MIIEDVLDKAIENPNNKKLEKFFLLAKSIAQESPFEIYKIGAVIKIKDKIVSTGYNSYKSHPVQKMYNEYRKTHEGEWLNHFKHAEFAALNKVKHLDLKKAEIFIYRVGQDGKPRMARPCQGCIQAILNHGISTIHYTTPEGLATETLINQKNKKYIL